MTELYTVWSVCDVLGGLCVFDMSTTNNRNSTLIPDVRKKTLRECALRALVVRVCRGSFRSRVPAESGAVCGPRRALAVGCQWRTLSRRPRTLPAHGEQY